MRELREAPETLKRIALAGVVVYFATWILAQSTGDPIMFVLSEILFGAIALGLGGLIYVEAGTDDVARLLAGGCLAAGGVLQLGFIALILVGVAIGLLSVAASILVFAGIGAYIYAIWSEQ